MDPVEPVGKEHGAGPWAFSWARMELSRISPERPFRAPAA